MRAWDLFVLVLSYTLAVGGGIIVALFLLALLVAILDF